MKLVYVFSGVALAFFLISANSDVAVAKVTEQVSNPTSPSETEPVLMTNLFRRVQEAVQTIQQIDQVVDSVNSLVEQENRRQELEDAREAATEQERLEAERRQQYFESLSSEEQQAYLEEQQAMQAQRDQAANLFMLMMMSSMFGGTESSPDSECVVNSPISGASYRTTWDEIPSHDRQYASCQ